MRVRLFMILSVLSLLAFCSPTNAGATNGPKRWEEKIDSRAKTVFTIQFEGGVVAEFAIVGDGGSDVDIVVSDAQGNKIAQDIGLSDLGMVRWTPTRTQMYRIDVINLGNVANRVKLGHN